MRTRHLQRRRLFWYVIPILVGMGGLALSSQFENEVIRFIVVLSSVSIPLFAGGNLLARHGAQGIERVLLIVGTLMLMAGAAVTIYGLPASMAHTRVFSMQIDQTARWLGAFSLLLGLFVVLFNVVRTGEAIDEVAERFRHLIDHMSEGLVLTSPDGNILLVNQRFLDLLDLAEERVVGHNARELVSRFGVDAVEPHLSLRAKGLASEYEITRNVRGEERQFWISGTPIFDRGGRPMGALATLRDVTEKNRMARRLEQYAKSLQQLVEEQTKKLRQSEEQFRNLLLHMNEGFLTIDSWYRIRFVNNRVCEMLAADPDHVRDSEIFDFVDAPGRVKLMELIRSGGVSTTEQGHPEIHFLRSDGTVLAAMVAVAPVRDIVSTADFPGDERYSLVITDVSALKRMQQQLEARAQELESANEELRAHGRAKDSFLSNVSHELKTPLSTIAGYIEMFQSGSLGELGPPQASALAVIERNLKRLVGLISEMIEFSRMEIRGVQLRISVVNIGKLVREAVASIQPHALAKDLSVSVFVSDDYPPVWADAGKISQVLGILLSNAVKFSHDGGMIQIRVSERPRDTLVVSVIDTGIGIDPAHHHRVFDKFYQVDGSLTRRYEGTGIGLSIAKSIVEAHGGRIELESALDKGCCFTIALPGSIFRPEVTPALARGLDKLRVLVVSESRVFRTALQAVLVRCGCHVEEAKNAYECVRLAEETEANLVLLDELPADTQGTEALMNLRQNAVTTEIPVIVFDTADPSKLDTIDGAALEAYHVPKPFTADDLLLHIRRACFDEAVSRVTTTGALAGHSSRVLVVEPDPDLLEWIGTALNHRKIECYGVADVRHAVELAEEDPPDAVFVDADMDPAELGKTIETLRATPHTRAAPICVMSSLMRQGDIPPDGIAGAIGKPFDIDTMVEMIGKVRHRRPHTEGPGEGSSGSENAVS